MKKVIPWLGMALLGSFLFAGLPLLGWGWGDLPGYFANPTRLAYVLLTVVLQLVVAAFLPSSPGGAKAGSKTVDRQKLAVVSLQLLGFVMVLIPPYCDRRGLWVMPLNDLGRDLGLFLFGAGFLLVNWAAVALGPQFSVQVTLQPGHRLVTSGPYRHIRHPRYLGLLWMYFGLSLIFRSWAGLATTVIVGGILLWRIRDEEALMAGEFGAEWKDYIHRSWRLIPYLF